MENESERSIFNFGMDETTKSHFKSIALWARVNATIAFISLGLSVLTIILGLSKSGTSGAGGVLFQSLISWVISLLLNILLLNAATNIQKALTLTDQGSFHSGVSNLARYFKTIGILLIVFTSLVLVIIFFGIVMGGFGRA